MKNQLIKKAPVLKHDECWKIHNYFTPQGVVRLKHLKFNDFPLAEFQFEYDSFYMFKLTGKNGNQVMAYCRIVKNKS